MKEKINKILWDFAQSKLTHEEATQQVLDLFAVSGSALKKEQQKPCQHEFYEIWFVNEDKTPFELHGYECIKCGKTESMI